MVIQEAHRIQANILDIFYSVFCSLSNVLEFPRLQNGADQHLGCIILLPLGSENAKLVVFNTPPTMIG